MQKVWMLLCGCVYLGTLPISYANDMALQQEISQTINQLGKSKVANAADEDDFFVGPNKTKDVTVNKLADLSDDTYVRLEGTIIERLDKEKFIFADNTGKVILDIDDNVIARMKGAKISPNNKVVVFGVLDKEIFEKPEIEVSSIRIVQ